MAPHNIHPIYPYYESRVLLDGMYITTVHLPSQQIHQLVPPPGCFCSSLLHITILSESIAAGKEAKCLKTVDMQLETEMDRKRERENLVRGR